MNDSIHLNLNCRRFITVSLFFPLFCQRRKKNRFSYHATSVPHISQTCEWNFFYSHYVYALGLPMCVLLSAFWVIFAWLSLAHSLTFSYVYFGIPPRHTHYKPTRENFFVCLSLAFFVSLELVSFHNNDCEIVFTIFIHKR